MKILLTGKNGQVGWELNRSLLPLGEVYALSRHEADLSEPEGLRTIIRKIKPNVIVNAAAYTAVDKAEEEEDLATVINGVAPGVLAEEARDLDALLVHYSTDYVFDGAKNGVYTELDKPLPVNAYGRSKFAGEAAIQASECDHILLRTSWVYSARGHNFLLSILRLAQEKTELNIVDDQIGSPTWARFIAEATSLVVLQSLSDRSANKFISDTYNLTASGNTSWFGFADKIIEHARKSEKYKRLMINNINPIPSDNYPTPAKRPKNSVLSTSKLSEKFKIRVADWEESLELCFEDLI